MCKHMTDKPVHVLASAKAIYNIHTFKIRSWEKMVRPYCWMLQKAAGQVNLDESHVKPGMLSPPNPGRTECINAPSFNSQYSIHTA